MSLSALNTSLSASKGAFDASDFIVTQLSILNIKSQRIAEGTGEMVEQLNRLNEVSDKILEALVSNLDDLETRLESKTTAASGSFIPNDTAIPASASGAGGGAASSFISGALGGLGAGMLSRAGAARALGFASRGLAAGVAYFAAEELGDFLTELTGNESLGDVAEWTTKGGALGSIFGPPGIVVGSIAGFAYGAAQALTNWMDEKRAEFERDVNDTLAAMGADPSTSASDFLAPRLTPEQRNAISSMPIELTPGITAPQAVDAALEGMTPTERDKFSEIAAAAQAGDPSAQEAFTQVVQEGYLKLQNQEYLAPVRDTAYNAANMVAENYGVDDENYNTIIRALTDFRLGGEAGLINLATEYNLLSNRIKDYVLQGMSTEEIMAEGPEGFQVDQNTFNRIVELSRLVTENNDLSVLPSSVRETAGSMLSEEGGSGNVVIVQGGSQPAPAPVVNVEAPKVPMGDTIDNRFNRMYRGIPGGGMYGYTR